VYVFLHPGPPVTVDSLDLGASSMRPSVVGSIAGLTKGRVITPEVLEDARDRLMASELFASVGGIEVVPGRIRARPGDRARGRAHRPLRRAWHPAGGGVTGSSIWRWGISAGPAAPRALAGRATGRGGPSTPRTTASPRSSARRSTVRSLSRPRSRTRSIPRPSGRSAFPGGRSGTPARARPCGTAGVPTPGRGAEPARPAPWKGGSPVARSSP
jgi:hypothetical protein